MTVNEFVEKYKKANDVELSKLVKEIDLKTYVPFAEKVVHSEVVLNGSANRVNGVLQSKSPMRFLTFAMSIITLYTNIETDKNKPHEEYDALKESGAMEYIIARIGRDIEEFTNIYNITYDDMIYNENNWRTFVSGQFASLINAIIEAIGDEELSKQISKLYSSFS